MKKLLAVLAGALFAVSAMAHDKPKPTDKDDKGKHADKDSKTKGDKNGDKPDHKKH